MTPNALSARRGPACVTAENVSQVSIFPLSRPRRSHSTRCAEEPCVNDSGTTRPCDCFCKRSSPIAAAARKPSSASPGSSRFCCAA